MLFSFPARVNQVAARLVAATVATTLVFAFALHLPWLVGVLAVGFLLRVGWGPKLSPLGRAATLLAPRLAEPQPVPGTPKRFAQAVGAACTLTATALLATGHATAGWAIAGLVVVFATLEAGIGFCAGCLMFRLLQRAGLVAADRCETCVTE